MSASAKQSVADFLKKTPNDGRYIWTFDSERGASEADLCRKRPGDTGQGECVKIAMESTALLTTMQSLGFFCALPQDPGKTEIECQKIASEPIDKL